MLAVSAQEIAQGVGIYPGVFDAYDFLFNAVGIGIASGLDVHYAGRDKGEVERY